MKPGLVAFLALAVLPLTSCGGASGVDEWAGPPRPDRSGGLSVGSFNDHLAEHDEDARSPVVAATAFLRLDRTAAATTTIAAHATEEGSGPTTVTVMLDRLPDDSVRGQRFELVFTQQEGEWRLATATTEQRCWPSRGHQDFSTEPCL